MKVIQVEQLDASELTRLISDNMMQEFKSLCNSIIEMYKDESKPHMTLNETAEFFKISKTCLRQWVKQGLLNDYKVSGKVFFSKAECIELILGKQAA